MAKSKTFAAIDVGSHNVTMKLIEKTEKGYSELENVSHVIDLGTDTYMEGRIRFPMVEQCCTTLKGFSKIMKDYRTTNYVALATSALREASNKDYILAQITLETGLKVTVINNSTERYLDSMAVIAKYPSFSQMTNEGILLVDVGAGSIQVSLYSGGHLTSSHNIRLGSLRVRELLSDLEKKTLSYTEVLDEYIKINIASCCSQLDLTNKPVHFIGMGPVSRYLKQVASSGDEITRKKFYDLCSLLSNTPADDIALQYGIPWESAELLLPSAFILRQFLNLTDAQRLLIPSVDLCDGIIANWLFTNYPVKGDYDLENDILENARFLAKRFHCNEKHAKKVEKFAVKLYRSLQSRHGFGSRQLLLLRLAAILQDIGEFISSTNLHHSSYDILKNSEILGLSHREREIVALVIKYSSHEKPSPSEVPSQHLITVARLSAILKLASALDYSSSGKMQMLKTSIKNKRFVISITATEDITLEKWEFGNMTDFFEEVYGLLPELKMEQIENKK